MKRKIIVKIVIAILLTIAISFISTSLMPVLGNDVAINQLENDDAYFIAMNTWHQINNYLNWGIALIWLGITVSITVDIYKIIKTRMEKTDD